ncbi:MAG: DUF507 family protein [Thermodesulfovibrionales bacterium]
MRIPKSWVPIIAGKVIDSIVGRDYVEPLIPVSDLKKAAEEILLEDLSAEDRLNEEVREILRQHEKDIEFKKLDYKRLFDMTKQKLVRERNLIL